MPMAADTPSHATTGASRPDAMLDPRGDEQADADVRGEQDQWQHAAEVRIVDDGAVCVDHQRADEHQRERIRLVAEETTYDDVETRERRQESQRHPFVQTLLGVAVGGVPQVDEGVVRPGEHEGTRRSTAATSSGTTRARRYIRRCTTSASNITIVHSPVNGCVNATTAKPGPTIASHHLTPGVVIAQDRPAHDEAPGRSRTWTGTATRSRSSSG